MMLITEMDLPDFLVRQVIKDYRKLVKLSDAIPEGDPFRSILSFMEGIIPAFKNRIEDGEISDDYYRLRELVLSREDDDEVTSMLLGEMPIQEEGTQC